jgi:hypothetical protein
VTPVVEWQPGPPPGPGQWWVIIRGCTMAIAKAEMYGAVLGVYLFGDEPTSSRIGEVTHHAPLVAPLPPWGAL